MTLDQPYSSNCAQLLGWLMSRCPSDSIDVWIDLLICLLFLIDSIATQIPI